MELKPLDIIKPINSSSDFRKISVQSSLYFKQGKELLEAAIDMSELTSPIIQYYGFLQYIKGIILLEYELKEPLFFSYHGIKVDNCQTIIVRNKGKIERKLNSLQQKAIHSELKYPLEINMSKYANAKIMPFGVFSALIIHKSNSMAYKPDRRTVMDYYLSGRCSLSLEELVDSRNLDIYKVFIISWLISSIVRYKPVLWQEIITGSKDTIIKQLIDFTRNVVPNSIIELLHPYLPYIPTDYF